MADDSKITPIRRTEPRLGKAATVSIRIGERATFDAGISSTGLLAVAALVSGILLSSAVIVLAAGRRKPPLR
ncbi:hypothetical protein [Sphingomonas sp. MMS24-J13]|uniref:hypothetical protein n=1 Tax=Sphingomonas sp. MMS24-J13 TaxID=3238686 RepID=UPI00385086BE